MISTMAPSRVKFFVGLLYHKDFIDPSMIESFFAKNQFKKSFSTAPGFYSMANYYSQEMGEAEKLARFWLFFEGTSEREELVELKARAQEWEEEFRREKARSGRVLNIDPGFVSLEQMVLATGKPYSHRLYLGACRQFHVYGELSYVFQEKSWHSLPWTYPDYQQEEVKSHFTTARRELIKDLKAL